MGDPFEKVRAGQDVRFSATVYNAMVDAAKAEQLRGGRDDKTVVDQYRQSGIIKVRNDTETDLDRFAVLGLGSPVFLPSDNTFAEDAFKREVAFSGDTPAEEIHTGRFAILLSPCPSGQVSRAYVSGVCPVKIDVIHSDHQYADISPDETSVLLSADWGAARILWREGDDESYYGGDTGIQWAVVLLGTGGGAGTGGRIGLTGESGITGRSGTTLGSGLVTWYRASGSGEDGELEDTGNTGYCWNLATAGIAPGKYFMAKIVNGAPIVDWEECE